MAGICALCLSAVSRNNQAADPALALTLNPFNTEAGVNLVVDGLNADDRTDLTRLTRTARDMIAASRADARGYSILGAIEERAGKTEVAEALYATALKHSKSELHALLRTAELRLEQSDTAGALQNIDLLLRRWPDYWDRVQPVLLAVAAKAETAPQLTAKLNEQPPWRSRAIAVLAKEPAALGFLRSLIASAPPQVRDQANWTAERDGVVTALVSNKAYAEAYGLFLSTLTTEEAEVGGYVFDGGFSLPIGRSYFGWRVQKPGATEIKVGERGEGGATGLNVRFLDSPARPGIVTQNLMLPFGTYRLSVAAEARGLQAPKQLFWSVRCAEGVVLAELPVPTGSAPGTQLQVDLEVPASGCARQILSLDTMVRTESWRDRYQGEVRFSDLVITRL
ncbi:MAG: tetratricopeptide repeat protein [Devosia sp.]